MAKHAGRRRATLCVVGLGAVVGLVAGCTGTGSNPPAASSASSPAVVPSAPAPSPTPSTTVSIPSTLTAKERAAAESAIAVYTKFEEVNDKIRMTGGTDIAGLRSVAIGESLNSSTFAGQTYQSKGWHSQGPTRIVSITVSSVSFKVDPKNFVVPEVVMNSCIDSSALAVIDKNSKPVKPEDVSNFWQISTWVRQYVEQAGGVDGWFVALQENSEVPAC